MELRDYDEKCVRLTDTLGNVFEGVCCHNSADYNEHEFGVCEDGLQIANFLFYKRDISEIEILEDRHGPHGHYSSRWGLIEEWNVKDGVDSIEEELFCEEDDQVLRLLRCLDYYLDPRSGIELPTDEIVRMLKDLIKIPTSEQCRKEAEELVEKWGKGE